MSKQEKFDTEKMKEEFKQEMGFIPPGLSTGEELGADLQEIMADYHGLIWRDEVIPLKYKYLIALATAVFDDHETRAKLELKKAVKNGATREEIIEVLRQIVWLKGAPTLVKLAPILQFMRQELAKQEEEE